MFIRSEKNNQCRFCLPQQQTVNKSNFIDQDDRKQNCSFSDQEEELSELPDEAQFKVSNGEEDEGHDAQGQVVLPEPPGVVQHPLLVQKLLPRAAADKEGHMVSHRSGALCSNCVFLCFLRESRRSDGAVQALTEVESGELVPLQSLKARRQTDGC